MIALVVGLLGIVGAYVGVLLGLTSPLVPMAMAIGSTAVLAGIAQLAIVRRGRATPRLARAVRWVFGSMGCGFVGVLLMPAPVAGGPLLFGLPRVTAILLLVAGALPLLALPVAYARAFDDEVMPAPEPRDDA
ncbi:MAG: hypothetical protein ACKORK_04355 [Gemmatimonadota bacterium]